MAAAWLLGIAPAIAHAQIAPQDILKFRPTQPGVECETPTEPAAIDACKVESVTDAQKHNIGYALRDGQGKLLRKFVDTNGNKTLDQWSYYQDGFEVYRESDLNDDKAIDECRWMNAAGTRIAKVAGSKIVGWKRISAEEASKVLVQALVAGDLPLLESVMASAEELSALGLPKGLVGKVATDAAARAEQVMALQKGLTGWTKSTVWNRLDGTMPHLIPVDTGTGLTQDVTLYENAVIFAGPPNGQPAPPEMAFLQAPETIKIGDTWKFVELPRALDPKKAVVASDGGIRTWLFRGQGDGTSETQDPALAAALKLLANFDNANAALQTGGDRTKIARYHVDRIKLLRDVVKVAGQADDQLLYNKQIVDSLAAAYQTGSYPAGLEAIDRLIAEGGKIGSYAAFRKIAADFAAKNDEPGSDPMKNQKEWMAKLKDFVEKFPKAAEVADALLMVASGKEYEAEEEDARKYYTQLAKNFPDTDPGKKATGALRRLDLVGNPIELKGAGLRNEPIDTNQLRGKTILVAFWATWAEPVKRDLPELMKVYQKYHEKGFEIVGVSLDNERADLETFLKSSPLPWPQIFEPGGMESRLATEFGIISLPTMILVDGKGTVVNRNIRSAAELDRQLEKTLAGKGAGVALGAK